MSEWSEDTPSEVRLELLEKEKNEVLSLLRPCGEEQPEGGSKETSQDTGNSFVGSKTESLTEFCGEMLRSTMIPESCFDCYSRRIEHYRVNTIYTITVKRILHQKPLYLEKASCIKQDM